jgi:alpha-tubulin suppressor-like RCC1 family protein
MVESEVPKAVVGGHIFKSIEAGHYHVCGLKSDGTVVCWG